MHIVDGALATPVLLAGAALATAGVAQGLRQMPLERIPAAGVLSATFFVASLIHVPVGPSSVHLILNGLAGIVLGWAAFPALLVGLLLRAVFFGFGGLTVLGVNTVNIALPAVLVGVLLSGPISQATPSRAALFAALGGAGALVGTSLLVALSLALSGDAFLLAARFVLLAHLPLALIEGVSAAGAVLLVRQVKPDLFDPLARGMP